MRVLASRDVGSFMRLHNNPSLVMNIFVFKKSGRKKRVSASRTLDMMHTLVCPQTTLSQDSEFEVDDGATKAKIKICICQIFEG